MAQQQPEHPSNLVNTNNLLQAAADCASALLSDEDFERGVNRALAILGTSVGAERLGIGEHIEDITGKTIGHLIVHPYEWLSSYAASQFAHSEMKIIPYDGIEELYEQLKVGQHWGGSIENFPEPFRSNQQEKLGVKSTYAIPVMVNGQYWGIIGLDFCQTARELSDAEIAVLKTTATCIGSAIQRERNRRAKEEAERNVLLERGKAAQERAIQLAEHNRVLEQRDRILSATAEASNVLLTEDDFDEAINKALQIIGESIDTDRIVIVEIFENPSDLSYLYWKITYEWDSACAVSQISHPEVFQGSWEGIEKWYELFNKGQTISCQLEEMSEPFRSLQAKLDVKTFNSVPIFIEGKYWGNVSVDDCREETHRSEGELSIFKTAAACIGGAIERERTRRAKEEAERQILLEREQAAQEKANQLEEHNRVLEQRDRILAATTEASNVLLTGDDFDEAVNRALQIIGETIDTDRIGIVENFKNPSDPSYLYWKITYEWDSAYATPQINHPEVSQGSYEGIEEWYELWSQGQTISCQLEEMPEPFRSGQAELGSKTMNNVPIFIEGKYWGNVVIDDCREETHRSEAELSILKTAAACIGGAIERERTRRAKEEAERNILLEREQAAQERAKLLQAVATVANSLLRSPDYHTALPEVLQILGEAAKSDRCSLVQNVPDPITGKAAVKLDTEWCREGITKSVESTPELETALLWENFPQFQEKLTQGEISSFLIDELSEPARNILQQQGNVSMTLVPIMVQEEFWGVFGFDYCQEARLFEEANTAVFAIAVDSIAAAIEREQQDEALKRSEKRYRTLFELSNEGIYRFEFDEPIPISLSVEDQLRLIYQHYQIAEVNSAFIGQYGFSSIDEVIGKGLTDFYLEDSEISLAMNRAVIENDYQVRNTETEEIDANRQTRYFLQNVVGNVRDGYFWGGWGTQTDITELKQAQQALLEAEQARSRELEAINAKLKQALEELAESEKRYRTLFELSNEGIYRFEIEPPISTSLPAEEQVELIYQNYRFVEVNNTFITQYKLNSFEDAVGKGLTDFYVEGSDSNSESIRMTVENGYQIRNGESEEVTADGQQRIFLWNTVCDVRDGYVWGGWGMQTDITELKQAQQALLEAEQERARELEAINAKLQQALEELAESEKRYRTLFELSNEGIYRFEIDSPIDTSLPIDEQLNLLYQYYRITEVNDTFLEQFGFCSSTDVIGKGLNDFDPPGSLNWESNRAILQNGYQIRNIELEGLTADNRVRYFLSNIVCNITDGYVWGGWGMCTDITELKQAQQALLEAERQRVAQLEESNQILSLRDRWLEATANAANQLLATPDLDAGINAALKMLGESLDCDRVCVAQWFEDFTEETCGFIRLLYEWDSQYASRQILNPEFKEIIYSKEFEDMVVSLKKGGFVGGVIEELPDESFRREQIALEVKSSYAVGILVDGKLWGVLGLDYCREPKRLTLPEIAVFKTAASCVGSAIYRQQIQQEREEAERQRVAQLEESNQVLSLRDRWLEATALAANRLLATPDLDAGINAALKMLGENLDCDRVCILQHSDDSTGESLGFWCQLYEWDSPNTISQLHHPQLNKISIDSVEDRFSQLLIGKWWGGLIEEFPEPFRSGQIELGVKSTYAVPIFVNNEYWGILGIDFCREARHLTLAEIAVFKTAASCVGSAIYRQQTIAEQKEAERAVLEERNHLAREIHDTIGQSFTAIVMQLEAGKRLLTAKPDRVSSCLSLAQDLAHQGITQVQQSLWTLRENADEYSDLVAAFQRLVTTLNTSVPVRIKFSSSGTQPPLSPDVSLNLLRIGQEALTNALKHAEARHIDLNLAFNSDRLQLEIKDDGRGFAPELLGVNSGFGIRSIEQRAEQVNAVVNIITNPGNGTTITVTVPLTI